MKLERKLYTSIKDRLKTAGIMSGVGAGIGAGLGLLSKRRGDIIAGGIIGAALGAGLGFIARTPEDRKIPTQLDIKKSENLYTPEINRKISRLPKEYKVLSTINDRKLVSLMPDRESDEFIYIDSVDELSIRNQVLLGSDEVIIFRISKLGPVDIVYSFSSNKLKLVELNKVTDLNNIGGLKKFILSELNKDNKELKRLIELGEEFEDILDFQEYYINMLNKVI